MSDPADHLPSVFRFQKRPDVIMGLDYVEMFYAGGASSVIAIVVGIVAAIASSTFIFFLPAFIVVCLISFVVMGNFMRRYKYNRPNGFYQQTILQFIQRYGIGGFYILKSGYKNIERNKI